MLLSAAGLAVQGIVQETHPRLHGIHWLLYASNPLDGDTSLSSRLGLLDDTGAKHASRTKVCWSGYILSHTWDDGYVIFWCTLSIVLAGARPPVQDNAYRDPLLMSFADFVLHR